MREIGKEKNTFFLEDANLSPVASALFALPSSALRVQPYSHVQIIMQNILLYRSTQIFTQIYLYEKNLFSPGCDWWLNPSGEQPAVTLS